MKKVRAAVQHADESEILEAIGVVLASIKSERPLPDFVAKRIPELESLIRTMQDDEWMRLKNERQRLLATFV